MSMNQKELYGFGPFSLDPVERTLSQEGRQFAVTPKAFDLLLYLVRNRGRVLTKDELIRNLWPETFVEEVNLAVNISTLRKLLGEGPRDGRYIVTVSGRGYRFVAAVQEIAVPLDSFSEAAEPSPLAPEPTDTRSEEPPPAAGSTVSDFAGKSRLPANVLHPSRRNKTPWIISATLVLVLMIVAGTLLLRRHQSPVPTNEKDSILLSDIDNSTGEPVFDGALKEGMAIALEQSPFLDIIPADRVRETLRFMERSPDQQVRLPLAREICERLGAQFLITGSVARLDSSYLISVDAENCAGSDVVAREQAEAKTRQDVLPTLSVLGKKLRQKLGESLGSIERFDVPIEQATTPSLEALKAYSLGVEARGRGDEKESITPLEHAIELDPKFGMAYAQLGASYSNLGETEKAAGYTTRAFNLRANLSERERLYVTVRYNALVTGDINKAAETGKIWSEIYPRDATPFNGLAARYQVIGRYDEARAAAAQALKLQPHSSIPYANLATSLLALNQSAEAQRVCEQAAANQRDSIYTHEVLFKLAFLRRDNAAMLRESEWAHGRDTENSMLTTQAFALMASGRVHEARRVFEQAWTTSGRAGLLESTAYSRASEALAEADFGNMKAALSEAELALHDGHEIDPEMTAVEAFAWAGDEHRSIALADDLRRRYPLHGPLNLASIPSALAAGQITHGNPSAAIETLRQAEPYDLSEFANLSPIYVRAMAFLKQRSGKEAAAEFQKILDHPGIDPTSPRHPLAQLGLARSYALTGDVQKSRKAYEDFFALWSEADQDIPVLLESRREYHDLGHRKDAARR